jgi:hypothetical protein
MDQLHLVVFTSLWTAIWVAPLPKLSQRAELFAGLIPFAAFGLRVFAGFFGDVPDTDPIKAAAQPLLAWINGRPGFVPYQVFLDATVALGLVWLASAFDIPRRSRLATAGIMPATAVVSLLSWQLTGEPPEQLLVQRLPAVLLGFATGAAIAAIIRFTPSPLTVDQRRHAAVVALAAVPTTIAVARGLLALAGNLPPGRAAQIVSITSLLTGLTAGLTSYRWGGFNCIRSRLLFAMGVGVTAGAIVNSCHH